MATDARPEDRLQAALRDADRTALPASPVWTPGPAAVASPMRLATEWHGFHGQDGALGLYAKVLRAEMRELVDFGTSAQASRCAGETGASPRVVLADAARGVLVFEALPATRWRWARIDDLSDPA
ncbi:MAG: hypothetical protein ACRYHA_22250, partial [Janthinobacterium lividum]